MAEELQQEPLKKRIRVYALDELTWSGEKACNEVGPSVLIGDMRKCEHGGFIPVTAVNIDHAPYCSLCYPYLLKEKQ